MRELTGGVRWGEKGDEEHPWRGGRGKVSHGAKGVGNVHIRRDGVVLGLCR